MSNDELQDLMKFFDDRYVRQSDCDNTQNLIYKKLANDDKRIDLLLQSQKINNWLTTAIAGGIVTLVIKVFLGG